MGFKIGAKAVGLSRAPSKGSDVQGSARSMEPGSIHDPESAPSAPRGRGLTCGVQGVALEGVQSSCKRRLEFLLG